MPLILERNDITKMCVDAIVNPTNTALSPSGGTDRSIHLAAGKRLLAKCEKLGGCEVGEAKITRGYKLSAKYIIHTVGPVWRGGSFNEEELLRKCYNNSLMLALKRSCKTVALPLISSGAFGFPKKIALDIATDEIRKFLDKRDITVYLVVYDTEAFGLGKELFPEIKQFIDDKYSLPDTLQYSMSRRITFSEPLTAPSVEKPATKFCVCESKAAKRNQLEEKLKMLDESFSELLLRKIDESGMTDSECYKKANIDRKLFSKIRSNKDYRPSKPTVLAFAIALEMDINETKQFLSRAGFAFSSASKFDVIVEYFITGGVYDIFEINNALFAFDQNLLGA